MAMIYEMVKKQDWLYCQLIRKHDPELWAATVKLIQARAAEKESREPPQPPVAA